LHFRCCGMGPAAKSAMGDVVAFEDASLKHMDTRSGAGRATTPCGTYRSSVVTLCALAMGCGVLALPRVMALCGPIRGLMLLVLFAVWVDATLRWTVACGRFSGRSTFAGNARYYIGPNAALVVHSAQMALLFGGIVSLFVVVASLLPCIARDLLAHVCSPTPASCDDGPGVPALGSVNGDQHDGVRLGLLQAVAATGVCRAHPMPCLPRDRLLVAVTALVLPLASQGSLTALRRFSSFGLGCLMYFFVAVLARTIGALGDMFSAWPMSSRFPPGFDLGPGGMEGTFWAGPPILLMSLLCHTSILRLDEELRPESKQQVSGVIHTVVLRVALPIYALVALGGYLLCGPGVSPNILEDFRGDVLMAAARLTLGVMNIVKIPLGVVALREDLIETLPWPKLRRQLATGPWQMAITAVLVGLAALAASSLGSLSRVLALMGCTVGVLFGLCVPAALYWCLLRRLERAQRAASGDDTMTDLRRSLLRGGLGGTAASVQIATARVAGAIQLPTTAIGRLRQRFECGVVFVGGVALGVLGLGNWLAEGA